MIQHLSIVTTPSPRRMLLVVTAGALALSASFAALRYIQILQRAENRNVEIGASYRAVNTLESLSRQADLIVVGHAIDAGKTRRVLQPVQQAVPFQPNQPVNVPDEKAKLSGLGNQGTIGVRGNAGDPAAPSFDSVVTDFTFEITRVLHGQLKAGAQISVTQPGGPIELPTFPGGPTLKRTIEFEHDPLIVKGQEHALFLSQTKDGKYYVVGGPQGRLTVDNGGKIHPIDPAAPATRGRAGQTLESFAVEVQRARGTQSVGVAN